MNWPEWPPWCRLQSAMWFQPAQRFETSTGNTSIACRCVWKNGCRHTPKWSVQAECKGELDDSVDGNGVGYSIFRNQDTNQDKPMWLGITGLGWRQRTSLAWTGLRSYTLAPPSWTVSKFLWRPYTTCGHRKSRALGDALLSSFSPCKNGNFLGDILHTPMGVV